MSVLEIIKNYKIALSDAEKLVSLKKNVKNKEGFLVLLSLQESNNVYQEYFKGLIERDFPGTLFDMKSWSDQEILGWLEFLNAHPDFLDQRKDSIIYLFWAMIDSSSVDVAQYKDPMIGILLRDDMLAYLANSPAKSTTRSIESFLYEFLDGKQYDEFVVKIQNLRKSKK